MKKLFSRVAVVVGGMFSLVAQAAIDLTSTTAAITTAVSNAELIGTAVIGLLLVFFAVRAIRRSMSAGG